MHQLSSLDAQFLAFEDARNFGHIAALSIYDPATAPGGELTADGLRDLVAARLHLLAPFRRRLAPVPFGLDHPYWIEDPDFDLEFHIRELALPAPGDDRRLAEQVARIHARPLDRAHPLWELYLIHGLPHGRVALLTKIHHAAIDGVSGQELLSVLLDPSPEGRSLAPAPEPRAPRRAAPGELEMLARGVAGMPHQPLRALRVLPRTLAHLDDVPTLRTLPGVGAVAGLSRRIARARTAGDGGVLEAPSLRAPRTSCNGAISAHRRFAFASLSLTDVKAVKDALGVTVNDVVVAVCAGALRGWLAQRGELPSEPLLAMIPVSVREESGDDGEYGNRTSAMIVPIPTDVADPLARVLCAHEALRSAKERHRALPATLLQDANHFIPPALFARAARVTTWLTAQRAIAPPVNVVISNVPGSRAPLYCGGATQLAAHPVSVIMDGVGLNISVMSYRDSLDFGVVADRGQVGDAWPLMDALGDSLDELVEHVTQLEPAVACGA
jgi:WS/DGAT/MGAT family acyltransferase